MTAERCRLFEDCLAPLCPLDPISLKGVWYSDEEICRSRTHGNLPWIRAQRKVARVRAVGYFTLEMLHDICTARKGLTGLDPNEEEQAQLRRWLDLHARKRSAAGIDRREKELSAMAGNAAQPDLSGQGVAGLEGGIPAPLKNVAKQGGKVKIHAETGGPSTPTGAGRVNPRAGDLSAEKGQ